MYCLSLSACGSIRVLQFDRFDVNLLGLLLSLIRSIRLVVIILVLAILILRILVVVLIVCILVVGVLVVGHLNVGSLILILSVGSIRL